MQYKASFGRVTWAVTLLTTVILTGVSFSVFWQSQPLGSHAITFAVVLPLAILAIAALFRVTAYQITREGITVKRIIKDYHISAEAFESAEYVPDAMAKSLRLFGNGGLFGFYGLFSSKALGKYRAFVTDSKQTVVVKTAGKTWLLSPQNPKSFCSKANARFQQDGVA